MELTQRGRVWRRWPSRHDERRAKPQGNRRAVWPVSKREKTIGSARAYHESELLPALREFAADPTDVGKARVVADAANNLVERMFLDQKAAGTTRLGKIAYRDAILGSCPEFGLIWDVADARKQLAVEHALDLRDFSDDFRASRIIVEDKSGSHHDFAPLMGRVAAFLSSELKRLGM